MGDMNEQVKRAAEQDQLEKAFIAFCSKELIGYTIDEVKVYIKDDYAFRSISDIRKANNVIITHDYHSGRLNVATDDDGKITSIMFIG
jgi:hypothetical protein